MNIAGFEFWLTARGLAPVTISDTVKRIAFLERHGALTPKGFERFLVANRNRYTNNSLNIYLKALKNYGKYTRLQALVSLKLLPRNSSPRQSLSLTELTRFLAVRTPHKRIRDANYGLFFRIMALTGARPGEIARLREKNVSRAEGCLYLVDTKTHDTRKVPLPSDILYQIKGDPPFPVSPQGWFLAFHYRLKKAGILRPNLTPYSLRHTAITLLLQQPNSNLFDVQNLVGHKSASTTAIYYHSCLERIKRVVQSHPLISNGLSPLERARIITDTIRTFGIDLNPTLHTLKDDSIEIKLNIPPPKSGKPHSVA